MPIPVLSGERCIGHMIQTPKGIRVFDANDHELGMFGTQEGAVLALQELAKPAKRRAVSLKPKV